MKMLQQEPALEESPWERTLAASRENKSAALDLLLLLVRGRRQVVLCTLALGLLGLMIVLVLKPTFTATATILPPQAPQSSLTALMGQLGALSGLGGGGGSLLKNPADMYVGILQSRTISDKAIDTLRLQDRWHLASRSDAEKRLASQVHFELAKDGLIEISAKDHTPQEASRLANFFVDALYEMNSHLAISEASQRRLFFDQQLASERSALAQAEDELKATQQRTGLITLSGQAELAVRSIAQTRAQISSKEVELQGLRAYEAEENPDVQRVLQEIGALRSQLSRLEDNQQRLAPGDTQIAANQVPSGGLEYARKLRDVKYHETLFDLLSRQYEAARIDEAKSAPIIQVVDRAVPPDKKSGPPRLLIVAGSLFLGFCLGCLWVFLEGALMRARGEPELAGKLDQLSRGLRWRA